MNQAVDRPIALVTGTSSGFGRLTAELLAQNGYRVFGTSRKKREDAAGVEMLELDVCSESSVRACVGEVLRRAGRVDLLVNNAGLTQSSPIEETESEAALKIFETNFWGAARMMRAVLPGMRERRAGRVINVSSLAGLVGAPGQGFYSASKHALEGLCETLWVELKDFNIAVVLIEPGFFRTNLHESMSRSAVRIPDYDRARRALESSITASLSGGPSPVAVAQLILRAARCRTPNLRYRAGADGVWIPRFKAFLPESWFLAGMRRKFGLNRL